MHRGIDNPVLRAAFSATAALMRATLALHIRPNAGRCVTLCNHGVTPAQKGGFKWQVRAVAARAIPTDAMPTDEKPRVKSSTGLPFVCVTFDDGFANIVDNALPALVEHKVPATVFVSSGNFGRKPAWHTAANNPWASERVMTAEELRSLPRDLITVGSHTVTHRRLNGLPTAEAEREMSDSKAALENILSRPVKALAFPWGAYDERIILAAYEAGYEQLFSTEARIHPGPLPHGLIGRFAASPDEFPAEFTLSAAGVYDWLYFFRNAKTRLEAATDPNGR